jgi:serine/threonine-protein kinase
MSTSDIVELNPGEFGKRYKIIAKLGEGGMATVHLAVVRGVAGVRKLVVLKSVRSELLADPKICEMFLAEARLGATLNHPNIVQTYEVVVSKGRPMLVMEYLDGQSLSRIGPAGGLPLGLALLVLKDVLQGLEYAHNFTDIDGTSLNLVHRDVTPQNVFLTYDGQIKLLDFGIAKVMGASSGHTETGEIKGKVRYMAPEQMVGSSGVDRRADVFSVGVMLWEAVTGQRLWDGRTDVQVIQAVLRASVPPPSNVNPAVPPPLEAICLRALAQDPDERYPSAAAMRADLDAAIDELKLRVDHRHIGEHLSHVFKDLRANIRSAIEGQLRDEKALPVSLVVSEDNVVIADQPVTTGDLWGMQGGMSVSLSRTERTKRMRRRLIAAATLLLGTSGAVAGLMVYHSHETEGSATAQPPPPANGLGAIVATATTTSEPGSVSLSIEASPSQALITLDGEPLSGNPFRGVRPRDTTSHELRVEAPGYRTRTMTVSLSTPLETRVTLDPIPQTAVFHPHPNPIPTPPAPPPTLDPKAAASAAPVKPCNPPFYFDESGVKRFKPECLK